MLVVIGTTVTKSGGYAEQEVKDMSQMILTMGTMVSKTRIKAVVEVINVSGTRSDK